MRFFVVCNNHHFVQMSECVLLFESIHLPIIGFSCFLCHDSVRCLYRICLFWNIEIHFNGFVVKVQFIPILFVKMDSTNIFQQNTFTTEFILNFVALDNIT